mmetsp:Transcript_23392/g.35845  ORF Transcript_23392/g.35845 Transcript_23392/m.35845 type:complete len:265 (+) Transcript_23392:93-887(+)
MTVFQTKVLLEENDVVVVLAFSSPPAMVNGKYNRHFISQQRHKLSACLRSLPPKNTESSFYPFKFTSTHLPYNKQFTSTFNFESNQMIPPPHTGTPARRLAIQTPKHINEHVPNKLMNKIINTAAPRGLTLNFRCKNFLILSKYGEMEMDRANRAGRITLSITVNPAYIPRNAVFCPGASGDRPVLVQKMNHAQLTAITPLILLTNPYASNALIPNFPKDSLLNLFFLLEKNDFNVPKKDDVCESGDRDWICDGVSESAVTSAV